MTESTTIRVPSIVTARWEGFYWVAVLLTFALGTAAGDLLSQARGDGGLGLGTTTTSAVFLVGIFGLVTYLARSRSDRSPAIATRDAEGEPA